MEQNLTRIFTLFGGLALFLYGMDALLSLIHIYLAQQLGAVGGLFTGLLGGNGVDSAVPVAGVLYVGVLLNNAEIQAVRSCIGGSKHTAVACTHNCLLYTSRCV